MCVCVCVCGRVPSRVQLSAATGTGAHQAPLSMGFSRQEYWSGLPFLFPGDLPHSGIKLTSLVSPALVEADSLPLSHLGMPLNCTLKNGINGQIYAMDLYMYF